MYIPSLEPFFQRKFLFRIPFVLIDRKSACNLHCDRFLTIYKNFHLNRCNRYPTGAGQTNKQGNVHVKLITSTFLEVA